MRRLYITNPCDSAEEYRELYDKLMSEGFNFFGSFPSERTIELFKRGEPSPCETAISVLKRHSPKAIVRTTDAYTKMEHEQLKEGEWVGPFKSGQTVSIFYK